MRIAQCLEYPLQQQGGTEVIVRELIRGLAPLHQITLVSPDTWESLQRSPVREMIDSHVAWDPRAPGKTQAEALAHQLARKNIDVAHFHFGGNFGWGTRIAGRSPIRTVARRQVRVFSTVHSVAGLFSGYCGPQRSLGLRLALFPAAWLGKADVLRQVQREIAVSLHDLRLLQQWYRPWRRRFVQIYHSRLGPDPPHTPEVPREKLILNVGHIAPRKGQDLLVMAFALIAAQCPGWKLAMVGPRGDPSFEKGIGDTIRSAGLQERIEFVGTSDHPQDWMRRAAIYVQPSREEALGLALQEAMASGCACIGTSAGGIPELLEPSTGVLVPAGNPAALADAVKLLISQDERRNTMGRNAAASINRRGMNRQTMVMRHLELYAGRV